MKLTRFFLILLSGIIISASMQAQGKIDRKALVTRHNIQNTSMDTMASLTVGNGNFAFTVDATGMQTFPDFYKKGVPLGTQSQWGWHSFPDTAGYKLDEVLKGYDFHGRQVTYSVERKETPRQEEASNFLRKNAHRLHLGTIGLELLKKDGSLARPDEIFAISQTLNLWTGEIFSFFIFDGVPVEVTTYCHQEKDMIAARINSPLMTQGRLRVVLRFPYPTGQHTDWACEWNKPQSHSTALKPIDGTHAQILRKLDSTKYAVSVNWNSSIHSILQRSTHEIVLQPAAGSHLKLEFACLFSKTPEEATSFEDAQNSSAQAWARYWSNGGAVDFSGSTDPRANELERRIVLSQYLTRIQCGGDYPPQETGLTYNSWFGKYHLEMHWWHAAHFAQWGHPELLERSLWWYKAIADKARVTATRQGFDGLRWPKMVDTSGNETPSKIGQMLIWQQPHFIYFAEQMYRTNPSSEVLNRYKEEVFGTADFMASFAWYDAQNKRYVLGPTLIAAQESVNQPDAINTPYELAYWYWGLSVAQQWRERLGMPRNEKWDDILKKLPKLPKKDGLYLASETAPDFSSVSSFVSDHPAVLGAYGVLPASPLVNPKVMKATYDKVLEVWRWETTWGWDYPMMAMAAVRLGMPEKAIDALLLDVQKNTYLKNGHNFQDGRLRIYLPGNGGLLMTVAMMCAGYDGCKVQNPGIPQNGKWNVKWEGLSKLP
jgi:hypothetical protein